MEAAEQQTSTTENAPEQWQRVLWKKQPYPDNYIGPDFFRLTKKRLRVCGAEAVLGCSAVTQEVCCCLYLVSVFAGLSKSLVQPWLLLSFTALYALLGYCRNKPGVSVVQMSVLSVVLCGTLCSVVQSLTASVATDTIYACTTVLLLLHVALHDYGGHGGPIANETLSHNVGVFACVCLASRLTEYWQVFAFTITTIAVFARHDSKALDQSATAVVLETVALLAVTVAAVCLFVPPLLPLLVAAVVTVNLLLPLLYVHLQYYRQNIYGPWDEARIDGRGLAPRSKAAPSNDITI